MLEIWINDQSGASMGVKVLRLPPPSLPKKRIERIFVPGRSGALTRWRGDYETIDKPVQIHYRGSDVDPVLEWLRNASTVRFSNDATRTYECFVDTEAVAVRMIADWYTISITFVCQPMEG